MLATRMNELVLQLEAQAESVRSGASAGEPPLALSVEIFETLPSRASASGTRCTSNCSSAKGRELSTFDRETIAKTISAQLEPVKDPQTGRFVEKNEYTIVEDLRRAMVDLGRERLRKEIFGDQERRGLTLGRASKSRRA